MSKRYYPQQFGDRKKAKLDVSISDHNFPLSQNNEVKDVDFQDNWGDDNDDEILLLASQACEQAYSSNNISVLPDYSICMQPGSTSTQLTGPSTSKTEFTFKKPSTTPSHITTSNLKEKFNRIASPLPGITDKIISKTNNDIDLTNDFKYNDRVYKGQDSDQIYRQFLQLQEENEKLKAENGKLLEKCVTKEGEASILRTQLKSCHIAVDNARLEKIKAQEKVQAEWTEKLAVANTQLHDLRTQLDFKNLEIISVKEKCKKLESNKVKLTQVTIGHNDMSQRQSSSFVQDTSHLRKVKTVSNYVQTDIKAHFVPLNISHIKEKTSLIHLLPSMLEPSTIEQYSLVDNEKLCRSDSATKCRIYSTFHRIPTTPKLKEVRNVVQLNSMCEDLTSIANGCRDKDVFFRVYKAVMSILIDVENKLHSISKRMSTAFQKEMDEKYIETTNAYLHVDIDDLLKGKSLYKEEQDIQARRATAILARILENSTAMDMFHLFENSNELNVGSFLHYIHRICCLLDGVSCSTLYSGLLLSLTVLLEKLAHSQSKQILDIIKTIITSRPMPFVIVELMELVRIVSVWERFSEIFCPASNVGNLKVDYDQGVLLYKKDSCGLQVLLKQVESLLKCIENQHLSTTAVQTTRQLINLYNNMNCNVHFVPDKSKCECKRVLIQVLVYSLKISAVMLDYCDNEQVPYDDIQSVCRCGVHILYQCTLRDVEFSSQLSYHEGHLIQFCEVMRRKQHPEVYANMLSELASTLQPSPEEMPPSFHRQPWIKSFQSFSMAD